MGVGGRPAPIARRQDLQERRDLLCAGLAAAGLGVRVPASTYFAVADIRPLGVDDGLEFCLALPERVGVVAIPTSVFYDDPAIGRHLVRFAFCKNRELLTAATERLADRSV